MYHRFDRDLITYYKSMDEVREAEDPVENICETEMEEEEEGGAVESTELFLILVLVPDVG